MRWPVILTVCLSVVAMGLEQAPVVGQIFPGVARACGGCGRCGSCRIPRLPRRFCNRCRGVNCMCPPIMPQMSCAAPANLCAPVCPPNPPVLYPEVRTTMHPKQVVSCEMVPQTCYRREAYCEQVPVTTYKQVVITVPQTEYRNVVRHQMVAHQVMVPQRRVSTCWEPRYHVSYRPVCPPMVTPQLPVYTDGCTDGHMGVPEAPYPQTYQGQPTLTVPSAPNMGTQQNQRVPIPREDPGFRPTNPDQTYYRPGQYGPTPAPAPYFDHARYDHDHGDDFRTLQSVRYTPNSSSRFVPAPAPSAAWRNQY